jgi:hypothetical protein
MHCPALQVAILSIQDRLRDLYMALDTLQRFERKFLALLRYSNGTLKLRKQRKFASAQGDEDLKDLTKAMRCDVESFRNIAKTTSLPSRWMEDCDDIEDNMEFLLGQLSKNRIEFPTHEELHAIFQGVLSDAASAASRIVRFGQAHRWSP